MKLCNNDLDNINSNLEEGKFAILFNKSLSSGETLKLTPISKSYRNLYFEFYYSDNNYRTMGIISRPLVELISNVCIPVYMGGLSYFTIVPIYLFTTGTTIVWDNTNYVLLRIYVEYN